MGIRVDTWNLCFHQRTDDDSTSMVVMTFMDGKLAVNFGQHHELLYRYIIGLISIWNNREMAETPLSFW